MFNRLENCIYNYLECLKSIQDYKNDANDPRTPYALEMKRTELHENLLSAYIGLFISFVDQDDPNDDIHLHYKKSKAIFDNLDKVCEIYSLCEEWKLKTESDVKDMTKYLYKFLVTTECRYFFEKGRIPHVLVNRINHRDFDL